MNFRENMMGMYGFSIMFLGSITQNDLLIASSVIVIALSGLSYNIRKSLEEVEK